MLGQCASIVTMRVSPFFVLPSIVVLWCLYCYDNASIHWLQSSKIYIVRAEQAKDGYKRVLLLQKLLLITQGRACLRA
jgi:hypothetical protein